VIKRILVVLGLTSLISGLSYYLWTEYRVISSWDFVISGVSVLGLNSEQTTLTVKLKIINPSNLECQISRLSANCFVNGSFVGALSQPDVMSIPANGFNFLSMNVILQDKSFFDELLNFTSTGNPIKLEVTGTVFIQSGIGLTVPFDETSTYTLADLIS